MTYFLACKNWVLAVIALWGSDFVGAVLYTDDLALLAPSAAALRIMLQFCEAFDLVHGLRFNAAKTQLIRFDCAKSSLHSDHFCCVAQVSHMLTPYYTSVIL